MVLPAVKWSEPTVKVARIADLAVGDSAYVTVGTIRPAVGWGLWLRQKFVPENASVDEAKDVPGYSSPDYNGERMPRVTRVSAMVWHLDLSDCDALWSLAETSLAGFSIPEWKGPSELELRRGIYTGISLVTEWGTPGRAPTTKLPERRRADKLWQYAPGESCYAPWAKTQTADDGSAWYSAHTRVRKNPYTTADGLPAVKLSIPDTKKKYGDAGYCVSVSLRESAFYPPIRASRPPVDPDGKSSIGRSMTGWTPEPGKGVAVRALGVWYFEYPSPEATPEVASMEMETITTK
jgi:hypothetical protein